MTDKTIVITRPGGQARQLSEMLQASLLRAEINKDDLPQILSLPLLTIVPRDDDVLVDQIKILLASADLVIFVSPNAIECTMRLLEKPWQDASEKLISIGVMGGSSLLALENHGIGVERSPTPIIYPQDNAQWDSEGLWAELQKLGWDWSTKKVVIFKGDGGRDWLAETLKSAGAQLDLISVYARVPLDLESPSWRDVHAMDFSKSLWLLTSSEAVRYLGQVKLPVHLATAICPHHNIAEAAEKIGFGAVLTCQPGDSALIAASQAWLAT